MSAALRTHVGKVRAQNEDSAWMDENRRIFAVADGMGGHLAGEVASGMAIEAVQEMASEHARPTVSMLSSMVDEANRRIYEHARTHPECAGMGTTLSLAWRDGHYMYIAHIGDSRIYRLRGRKLQQITEDHSLVWEMMRAGLITAEEARYHPRRNIITRALGTRGESAPDLLAADTKRGDVWLFCSDGLSGMVEDRAIEKTLNRFGAAVAADTLLRMALDAGGHDNITLIVYRDEED